MPCSAFPAAFLDPKIRTDELLAPPTPQTNAHHCFAEADPCLSSSAAADSAHNFCLPLVVPLAETSDGLKAGRGTRAPHAMLSELPPKCTYFDQGINLTAVSLWRKVKAQTSMRHGITSESRCSESRERAVGRRPW